MNPGGKNASSFPCRRDLLRHARSALDEGGRPLPGLDARLLVQHVCACSPESLLAHDEVEVRPETFEALKTLVRRRADGEPLAYLVGEKEFFGRTFEVTRQVLVPRPETEHLVEAVLERVPEGGRGRTLVDLGTGTGILAITLALEARFERILASDLSADALTVARRNARRHDVSIEFFQGDLFDALPCDLAIDVLVSNPPYVAPEALEKLHLDHEPRLALDGGARGGTAILDRILDALPDRLLPGGLAFLEMGSDQGDWARRAERDRGEIDLEGIVQDLAGLDRIAIFRHVEDEKGLR